MNPEIRFRVPSEVAQLAEKKARELGLERGRGRTGGASQLARGALYTALGLALPGDLHQLQQGAFQDVRDARDHYRQEPGQLKVTVHHRVDPEYRKSQALKQNTPVAARATTVFSFEQGELPDFLVPYIVLTQDGYPHASLNLEGRLSPRPGVLGELVSAQKECHLAELQNCLSELRRAKQQRQEQEERLQQQQKRGEQILADWTTRHGSELLQARREEGFDWLELACQEYCQSRLAELGIEQSVQVSKTVSLADGSRTYTRIRPQAEPSLESIRRLKQLRELQDSGIHFDLVTCRSPEGRPLEAVQVRLQTPLGERHTYLTELHPQ